MKKIFVAAVFMLNAIIVFYACKKDVTETTTTDKDTQTAQDNSLAEATFNDVNNIANEAVEDGSLSTYRISQSQITLLSNCATVVNIPDSMGTGGTITVDFGTFYCRCSDNRYRKGVINITYSGAYRDSGTQITTTFTNYFVGLDTTIRTFQVTGSKTVTNRGHNTAGNVNFDITVDGHMINHDGISMHWQSARNREWISGESTHLVWSDDEYVITGSASGTNFEGNSYTVNITHGLHFKLNCAYITEGTFELTPTGKATRTFDYGNGTCDANATLTVAGAVIPITLR